MNIPHTKEEFQKLCYEKYRLDWMLSHGFSLKDLIQQMNENYNENAEEDYRAYKPSHAMSDIENNTGLANGELWVCFNEFMNYEYKNKDYIGQLLKNYPLPYPNKEEALKALVQLN